MATTPNISVDNVDRTTAANSATIIQFNPATQLPIKLSGPHNFALWKAQVSMLMRGHNIFGHLDGSTKKPEPGASNFQVWFQQDQLIQTALLTSVEQSIASTVALAETAHDAWKSLHTAYANKSHTRILSLRDRLASSTKDTLSISEYLHQIRSISNELSTAGAPVSNAELIVTTLRGLGPEYKEISAAIRARDSAITYEELHDKLLDHEIFLKHEETKKPLSTPITANIAHTTTNNYKPSQASIPQNRPPNNSNNRNQQWQRNRKPNNNNNSVYCQLCDKPGHIARVCRSASHNHIQARANFAARFQNNQAPWIVDTGATHHISSDTQDFNNLQPYHGSDGIVMGNGTTIPITTTDESTALDALQTLADLSLMMPESPMESESSIQLKEERITVDEDDKSALVEASLTSQNRDKIKPPGPKQKLVPARGVEVSASRKSILGRELANDTNTLIELKEQLPSSDRTCKRKRKPIGSKVSNAKLDSSQPNDPLNKESVDDEENKSGIKGRHTGQAFTSPKQLKSVRSSESSLCSDQKDLTVSTAEVPLIHEVSLQMKQKGRRKMSLQRTFMPREKCSENILNNQSNKCSAPVQDRALFLKEKLSGCLSSYLLRRWCTFEWFYSAIDYPWFAKREFMEYLNHVGLGNIPRLTRVEWSVIKSSLGKPRRFSNHFLREERQKLEQYRESVRKHYTELRTGIRDGLPTDLARPLFVGKRVIALHPKEREVHDGSVLTVDHDKCRIQFDRPELGVEFVMDVDCMPMNPSDNMPESLRRQIGAGKVSGMNIEPQMNGNLNTCVSSGPLDKAPTPSSTLLKQGKDDFDRSVSQSKATTIGDTCEQVAYAQNCTMTHHQAREADIQALYELTRALDKKETLLSELRNANSDILENQDDIDCLRDSESFRKHYATVSSALLHLRERNTYPGNSLSPWMKAQASFNTQEGTLCSSLERELGSTVIDIIKGSRLKAHAMVIAAVQALSSAKEGEDALMKIGQVLDSIDYQQLASNSRLPVIRSHEQVNSSSGRASEALPSDASCPNLHKYSDKVDIQIPSELITSCVATLIMIQTCTERQYPPADVAQILDSAVTTLHPCCPQNLPIYREIQMCMGRIKTQMLALIPS